jgi:hypothetical protein
MHGSSPVFYAPGKSLFRRFVVFWMKVPSVVAVGRGESPLGIAVVEVAGSPR